MNEQRDTVGWGRLAVGLAFIAGGLLLLLERLGFLPHIDLHELWPLIVVAVGLFLLARAGGADERRGGIIVTLIGGWLLISTQGWLGLDFGRSWPLVILAVGLAHLLAPRPGRGLRPGIVLVGIGSLLLALELGVAGLGFDNAWPLFLVILGASLVWKALASSHARSAP